MTSLTPTTPTPKVRDPFAVQAATFSLFAPLVVIALNIAIGARMREGETAHQYDMHSAVAMMQAIFSFVVFVSGLILGVVALFGIKKHGSSRILVRTVTGLVLNGAAVLLFAAVFVVVFRSRNAAASGATADRSWSEAAYAEAGMSPIDRPWKAADFQRAIAVLNRVVDSDPQALPRAKSAKSGKVFACLTSQENLAAIDSSNLDLPHKMQEEIAIGVLIEPLGKPYQAGVRKGVRYDDELTEMYRFSLQYGTQLCRDMDAFVDSLPPAHPNRQAITQQFRLAKSQFTTSIDVVFEMLGDRKSLPLPIRQRLAGYVRDILPSLAQHMPEQCGQFMIQIRTLQDAETDPDLKRMFGELQHGMMSVVK